jgi:nucleotide-binding universal stress UspA family protein
VIAGYDGSIPARRALAYAAGTARRLRRPLLAFYVTPAETCFQEPLTGLISVAKREAAKAVERRLLAELDDLTVPEELEVHYGTRQGNPAQQLAALAAELRADALVIGTPERSRHHLTGSVPGWLARHATCPIIVIP